MITQKTFHVHLNTKAKEDYHYGCYYQVQRIQKGRMEPDGSTWEFGTVDFGTNSRIRLFFHLLKMKLQGYRKDKRKWST